MLAVLIHAICSSREAEEAAKGVRSALLQTAQELQTLGSAAALEGATAAAGSDGAGAAADVEECGLGAEAALRAQQRDQPLGRGGVDLEEGPGRDTELQTAQRFHQVPRPHCQGQRFHQVGHRLQQDHGQYQVRGRKPLHGDWRS